MKLTKTVLGSDVSQLITLEVMENSIFVHMWSTIVEEKGVNLVRKLIKGEKE